MLCLRHKKVHPVHILVQVLDALRTLTAEQSLGAAMLQQCNPFVQVFKQVKEIVTTQDVNLCFLAKPGKNTTVVPALLVVHDALYHQ